MDRGRSAAGAAAIFLIVVSHGLALGQEPTPAPPAPKGATPPDAGPRKPAILTVEVRTGDPGKSETTRPVPDAMVRIEGADDVIGTNPQGQVRFAGISSAKVTLQIMVGGADICRLPDIAVTNRDQVVKAFVDTSPKKERCRRLE